ncbi:MAG: M23 family metallopeptidase [Treponema sp.]|nr:M23 family metallopeptidase [Treponema sp.]
MNRIGAALMLLAVQSLVPFSGTAQDAGNRYPRITKLDSRDTVFRQYQADVEQARRRLFGRDRTGETPEYPAWDLTVYSYTTELEDDIFGLAARCNIPYSSLATVNRLAHPSALAQGNILLLPSAPGIFIPETPETDLERIMGAARGDQGLILSFTRNGRRERFRFIPGADFTSTERAFFLNTAFRFPLHNYRVTSSFGMRISPITGTPRMHEGLDLAAPEGTEVYAAREGIVTDLGEDPVYGKYVVIRHGENWVSLYGHLSVISANLRSAVRSGTLIGRVGSTGQSTGPHLHFELRQNGRAQDPGRFLFREQQ